MIEDVFFVACVFDTAILMTCVVLTVALRREREERVYWQDQATRYRKLWDRCNGIGCDDGEDDDGDD